MNINLLAKLTFFGLSYIYTVKLIDTIYHGIFRHAVAAGMVVGLNILAGLVQFLFFIILYRQFVPKDKPSLIIAACLAIFGSAVGMLPKLLAMALLVQPQSLFFFIRQGTQISALCPWLTAVLMLVFCLIFLFDSGTKGNKSLKRAFAAGAIGWFVMAVAQSLVLFNYLISGRLVWLYELFTGGPIVFVASSSLSFLCLSVFYLSFASNFSANRKQIVSPTFQ